MDWLFLWPESPALSLFVLWLGSVIFLWAARQPMLQLLNRLGEGLQEGCQLLAKRSQVLAEALRERSRDSLLAAGTLELQGRLDREFYRIDEGFSKKLEKYSGLHRRLDDLLLELDNDYKKCGDAPPDVPGWTGAVESIAALPATNDPNVHKVLEGIRKSLQDSERKTLQSYRDESAKRHKILGGMSAHWREVRGLMGRMKESVSRALETATRINGYVDEYEQLHTEREEAARARTYSAFKLFVISLLVLGIAAGGAFINFQLIALPMSELVPAGARVGGIPVATVSALVIVLMEVAVGFFLMDMLGITDLFPKLAGIPLERRRLILALAFAGLFFLASVESSLAILREQIVEADAVLKLALAGSAEALVVDASQSRIPVIGQAVLGFTLPWILAMVAIPLEMLLDSGRHVVAALAAAGLGAFAALAGSLAHVLGSLFAILPSAYDVYVSIPLRIEGMIRGEDVDFEYEASARRMAGKGATPSHGGVA
ncbi:MAG: hypothetical protein JRG96_17275 [Deltaproteobacteria bacterium]|nr:hypothetical protein [Deltaproteobacteria bacterium]